MIIFWTAKGTCTQGKHFEPIQPDMHTALHMWTYIIIRKHRVSSEKNKGLLNPHVNMRSSIVNFLKLNNRLYKMLGPHDMYY